MLKSKSLILFLFLNLSFAAAFAQPKPNFRLLQAIAQLDSNLVLGNVERLEKLVHPQLSMGHSNGLIETKSALIEHLQSIYLKYNRLESLKEPEIQIIDRVATVRRYLRVNGALEGKTFEVKLKVLETWIKAGRNWQLLNRQAIKSD